MGLCLGKLAVISPNGEVWTHCSQKFVQSLSQEGDTASLLVEGYRHRNREAHGRKQYDVCQLHSEMVCGNDRKIELDDIATSYLYEKCIEKHKLFDIDEKSIYAQPRLTDLQIYVVTWNMNGKATVNNIVKLLDLDGELCDLYVVGLQEAHSSVTEAAIIDALGDKYSCLTSAVMMSLQLFVFVKKSLLPFISNQMVDKVGIGGLGAVVGRQKGAVAVSLRFKEISLLFIVCHLSPHESNVAERNAQYHRIQQSIFAKQVPGGLCTGCSCVRNSAVADEPGACMALHSNFLEHSDVVVWLGDLNYRVEMSRSSVSFLMRHKLEEVLWSKDQLSKELRRGRVFKGFHEEPLAFKPTYKYDIGTDNYDTSSKGRVPSWTDRILYKIGDRINLKAHMKGYTSVNAVRSSDHRPVKAHLVLSNVKNM